MIIPAHITREVVDIFFFIFSVLGDETINRGLGGETAENGGYLPVGILYREGQDCKAILAGVFLYAAFFQVVDGVAVGGVFAVVEDDFVVGQFAVFGKQLDLFVEIAQL